MPFKRLYRFKAVCDLCGEDTVFEFPTEVIDTEFLNKNHGFKNSGWWFVKNLDGLQIQTGCVCPECAYRYQAPLDAEYTSNDILREFPNAVPCIIDNNPCWLLVDLNIKGKYSRMVIMLNCRNLRVCPYFYDEDGNNVAEFETIKAYSLKDVKGHINRYIIEFTDTEEETNNDDNE